MKVLLVHPYMNVRGGAERQVINLGIELKKLGVDVKLLTFLIEKNKGYNEFFDKLEIIVFPKLIPFKYLLEFYPLVVSVMDYSKIFDKFDVINVHNFPANWIIQNCNKPVIWSANEVPWLTYSPTFMRFLRKRFLYKIFAKIDK
ncbi:MAG: glycosyltransferase, partial [Candidatus Aenigmarchaeota archaeon]|nr:glycosyltransferase [Candidatus Aenigmarchaeota archaeon]